VIGDAEISHTQRYFSSLQIETRRVFPNGPLHHIMALNPLDFPNAERLHQRGLMLPLYPMLNKAAVEKLRRRFADFISHITQRVANRMPVFRNWFVLCLCLMWKTVHNSSQRRDIVPKKSIAIADFFDFVFTFRYVYRKVLLILRRGS
jgi:hypothetical protein